MRDVGRKGECYAAAYLENKGYRILAQNYSSRYGEIDIIALAEGFIAFVEVKTRSRHCSYAPCEAVNAAKMKKITRTALCYLQEYPSDYQPRFDVIEIVTMEQNAFSVVSCNHIVNAFDSAL